MLDFGEGREGHHVEVILWESDELSSAVLGVCIELDEDYTEP